jgi:hypothetical protein
MSARAFKDQTVTKVCKEYCPITKENRGSREHLIENLCFRDLVLITFYLLTFPEFSFAKKKKFNKIVIHQDILEDIRNKYMVYESGLFSVSEKSH